MLRGMLVAAGVLMAVVGCLWQNELLAVAGTALIVLERIGRWRRDAGSWRHRGYVFMVMALVAALLTVTFVVSLAVYGRGDSVLVQDTLPILVFTPADWVQVLLTSSWTRLVLVVSVALWCAIADLLVILVERPVVARRRLADLLDADSVRSATDHPRV